MKDTPKRLTPSRAVRRQCIICMGDHKQSAKYVADCDTYDCMLWKYRMGKGKGRPKLALMREYCLYCSQSRPEAANCSGTDCPFHFYRPGESPYPANNPNLSSQGVRFVKGHDMSVAKSRLESTETREDIGG